MFEMSVTYGGKNYGTNIIDAFHDAVLSSIQEMIYQKLEPFTDEIKQCNGSVEVQVPEDYKNMQVVFKNMPEELLERLTEAVTA